MDALFVVHTETVEREYAFAHNKVCAVGTALSSRPPLRSVRAELPHTAPTSGSGVGRTLLLSWAVAVIGHGVPEKDDCNCCEYRQFVKGVVREDDVNLTVPLATGDFLDQFEYIEDGIGEHHYGRRNHPPSIIDAYSPGGDSYHAYDEPSAMIRPGHNIKYKAQFIGKIIDTCNNNALHCCPVRNRAE